MIEVERILYFFKFLDKWMTQCFTSFRKSNYSYASAQMAKEYGFGLQISKANTTRKMHSQ